MPPACPASCARARQRAEGRLGQGAGRHGVLRGLPRGAGDRGLPARRLPEHRRPGGRRASARSSASSARSASAMRIYRGGVKLNLQRFFRFTGVVLALVAAGLVASTLHTAHEAGWINFGQGQALDLTWLVVPGTWTAALLTGMLGLQPTPTNIEVIGYLVYAIPAVIYVLMPARKKPSKEQRMKNAAVAAIVLTSAALLLSRAARMTTRAPVRGAKQVAIKLTDAGCEPASLKLDSGPHRVQGDQRRHRSRERVRGPLGRSHPRREGEPRPRAVGFLHHQLEAGRVLAGLPRRQDRRHGRPERRRQCGCRDRRQRSAAEVGDRVLPRLRREQVGDPGRPHRRSSSPRSRTATSLAPRSSSLPPARRTRRSSRSPSPSATSIPRSTRASTTSRRARPGRAFTRSSRACGSRTAPRAWSRSPTSCWPTSSACRPRPRA